MIFSPQNLLLPWIESLSDFPKKILLVPPDFSRVTSKSGILCSFLYQEFTKRGSVVKILPATGTHPSMTLEEIKTMFPHVPYAKSIFLQHQWVGQNLSPLHREYLQNFLSKQETAFIPDWLLETPFSFSVNSHLFEKFDKIISIGQVLPHEVVGISNYTKNIVVGLGNSDIIHNTHFLGALYGIENILGVIKNPVRNLIDALAKKYLPSHITYILSVSSYHPFTMQIYIGEDFSTFFCAASHSLKLNFQKVKFPIEQIIAYMPPNKFSSTWLTNKAIYRLRKIMKNDGILWIVAPGLKNFADNNLLNSQIANVGYKNKEQIFAHMQRSPALRGNLCTAAHLIHGNVNNRFRIVYCCDPLIMSQDKMQSVGFGYLPLQQLEKITSISLEDLVNSPQSKLVESAEKGIFLVNDPSLGCWTL